ncbi:hypothetical protein ACTXT7_006692 [Hymenolepis weldensis]
MMTQGTMREKGRDVSQSHKNSALEIEGRQESLWCDRFAMGKTQQDQFPYLISWEPEQEQ